ncbi:hypothetical protein D9M71_773670 [compost metagenome]
MSTFNSSNSLNASIPVKSVIADSFTSKFLTAAILIVSTFPSEMPESNPRLINLFSKFKSGIKVYSPLQFVLKLAVRSFLLDQFAFA